MKAILSLALVLGLCGLVRAEDKADPVGTWKCDYEIGDQKRTCELTIKKDGDKLTGTMSWPELKDVPEQKETNVKDLRLNDGNLTFSVARHATDLEFPINFKLTIYGDTFKGKGAAKIMGTDQEFDITGKREKKDK